MLNKNLINTLLFIALSFLLLPKIILIQFFSGRWIETDFLNSLSFLIQDFVLVIVVYSISKFFINKSKYSVFYIGFFIFFILVILLFDMRVRELWLKPLDFSLIKYSLNNTSDLMSGAEIFFNYRSGFGFTFRFTIFVLINFFLLNWLLISFLTIRRDLNVVKGKGFYKVKYVFLVVLFIGAVNQNNARYALNKNIFISSLVSFVKDFELFSSNEKKNINFEQPSYLLSEIKDIPKISNKQTQGFDNLVIVVLESVRWKSVFDGNFNSDYPTFNKLSNEGMSFKSYVSVPHSSKGYYSILLGLHAYPDIEIKEAIPQYQPSLIHELINKKNMEAIAFSSLNLQFENMRGFLKSIGISNSYSPAEIMLSKGKQIKKSSSFGSSDDYLFSSSLSYLKEIRNKGKGFVSLYFPSAAHYPYHCNKSQQVQKDIEKYEYCIKKTDVLLGEMLVEFAKENLLNSTLFVFVGDHGESFGEHGLYIHNSSMYEEEVTVPLIFWTNNNGLAKNSFRLSQQIDIIPTIADLFNMLDSNVNVQGKSLLRNQGERTFFMSTFFNELSSALVEHPFKYIYEFNSDVVKKYDLELDPLEEKAIYISDEESNSIKNRLESFHLYQRGIFE